MATGRPKKKFLLPVFDPHVGKWKIDVPASMAGTRKKFYFTHQQEALLEASRIVSTLAAGAQEVTNTQGRKHRLSNLIAGYLAERKPETSADNYTTLKWGLNILAGKYGELAPDELTPAITSVWIKGLKFKTRGRFNVFAACRTFYNSPAMQDLCKDNPFRDAPPKKDKGYRLPILTPDEMKLLLSLDLKPFFKAWLVAGAFSGVRSCEFERISYSAIDYKHKEIIIRREDSKQGEACRPRSIPIYPAFKRHMPEGTGPLDGGASWKKVDDEMEKALTALGWKHWKKNCLRHSFASYALAKSRDASKTAYEMGHASPALLYKDYANTVTRADALQWWAL